MNDRLRLECTHMDLVGICNVYAATAESVDVLLYSTVGFRKYVGALQSKEMGFVPRRPIPICILAPPHITSTSIREKTDYWEASLSVS